MRDEFHLTGIRHRWDHNQGRSDDLGAQETYPGMHAPCYDDLLPVSSAILSWKLPVLDGGKFGQQVTKDEFLLAAIAQNLRKLAKLIPINESVGAT